MLQQDRRAALYPYSQTFSYHGKIFHRKGFIALVKLSPFGGGHVVPHEKTHAGPIEDRMKLMEATEMQLSPIFGLFNDAGGEITKAMYRTLGRPESDGTLDGVRHQLWSVTDSDIENEVIGKMGTKPVYIADGHHRYTTALAYQDMIEKRNGGPLPVQHPANWCMFVLVAMQDDGLLIAPTHRLIGGLKEFDIAAFRTATQGVIETFEAPVPPDQLQEFAGYLASGSPHSFGLYDGKKKGRVPADSEGRERAAKIRTVPKRCVASARCGDPAPISAGRSDHAIICRRQRRDGRLHARCVDDRETGVDGWQNQIALLLRPTPLPALEDLGKTGDTMPQKSTYFFPKLATGMVLNPLSYP